MSAATMDAITFVRNSIARQFRQAPVFLDVAANRLRTGHYMKANDGRFYRTTLLEDEQTNKIVESVDFSTWNKSAQLTREDAASIFPDRVASYFTGDGATSSQNINRTGSPGNDFSGTPETVIALVENDDARQTQLTIRDMDASAFVARVEINWDRDTVTNIGSVSDAVGILKLGTGPNGGPLRLIWARGTGPSGNRRGWLFYPEGTGTGDNASMWLHYIDHVVGFGVGSPIVTTGSEVTRSADDASADFLHAPQEMTVYVEMVEGGSIEKSGATVLHIGTTGLSADPRFRVDAVASQYRVLHDNGTTNVNVSPAVTPSIGDRVELRGVLAADGSVLAGISVNGGSETTTSPSGAATLSGSWADATLHLGGLGGSTNVGFAGYAKIVVLAGTKTRAECRAAKPGDAGVLFYHGDHEFALDDTIIPVEIEGFETDPEALFDARRLPGGAYRTGISTERNRFDRRNITVPPQTRAVIHDLEELLTTPGRKTATGLLVEGGPVVVYPENVERVETRSLGYAGLTFTLREE